MTPEIATAQLLAIAEAKGATVDAETREAFARIMADVATAASEARGARADIAGLTREFGALKSDVSSLKQAVYGSSTPPPAPPQKPPPLVERTSKTEEETDELRGMILAIDGRTAAIDGRTAAVESAVAAFLKSKGIAAPTPEGEPDPSVWTRVRAFVGSREALKFVVAIVTLWAAASSALEHKTAPGPASTAPSPHGTVAQ